LDLAANHESEFRDAPIVGPRTVVMCREIGRLRVQGFRVLSNGVQGLTVRTNVHVQASKFQVECTDSNI